MTQRALDDALGALGLSTEDVEQCLVSHHHSDHLTMAMGLRQRAGLIVGLGEGEAPQLEATRRTNGLEGFRTVLLAAGATSVLEEIDYYNFFMLGGHIKNQAGDHIESPVPVFGPGPAGGT